MPEVPVLDINTLEGLATGVFVRDPGDGQVYLLGPAGAVLLSGAGPIADAIGQTATIAAGARDEVLVIQQDLDANYGNFVDQIADLNARLAPLEYGGISILTMSVAPSIAEIGASINAIVSWTLSGAPTAQTLNGVALADQVNDRSKNFAGLTAPNPTQAGSIAYALHVEDASAPPGSANEYDRSVSISWLPRRYWGVSSSSTLDAAGVLALLNSELSNSRSKNFTITANNEHVYIALPAYLGALTTFKIFGFAETPVQSALTVTTAAGATLDYLVWRSTEKLTGTVSVEIS